jgi:dephospho-CoA kinase
MHVIGILGGVASGKSEVARQFERLGCGLLDADRAGHEVLAQPEVVEALICRWGQGILDATGYVNRAAVAKIVFVREPLDSAEKAVEERQFLEQLTHPRIAALLEQQKGAFAATGRVRAVVLDAALLLEAGWDKLCDTFVFVDAPRTLRLARAQARGWSESEFSAREAAQESLEAKRRRADFVIDTSRTLEDCRVQVESVYRSLFSDPTTPAKSP